MKKSFSLEKAEAGHPLITENGFKAEIIGVNRARMEHGKPLLVHAVIKRNQDAPCFIYDIDGKRLLNTRPNSSLYCNRDTNYDLYLDCPDVLRTIKASELPDLFLVQFRHSVVGLISQTTYLAMGKSDGVEPAVLLPDCVGGFTSIEKLRSIKAEYKDLGPNGGTWKKFEVVE